MKEPILMRSGSCGLALASIPAMAECADLSAPAKPARSENLYPVEIGRRDREGLGARKAKRGCLPAGPYWFSSQERIGTTPRGYTALRKLGHREVALVYQVIEIEVEAGQHYQVAARLHRDRLDRERAHADWEPVVWRVLADPCDGAR
jgi:hypothetical protein